MDMLGLPSCRKAGRFRGHRIYGLRDQVNHEIPAYRADTPRRKPHPVLFLRLEGRDTHFQCGQALADILQLRLRRLLAGSALAANSAIASSSSRFTRSSRRIASSMRARAKRLDLLAEACQRGNRAAGHAGEIVEKTRSLAHSCQPLCRGLASPRITRAMILVTGGAGFIGSNLQAALVRRGIETVIVDRLGSAGKWRNLAKHPPARLLPPGDIDAFLESRPPLEMVYHLGAISDTTATDGDAAWATNVELSRHIWHWCANHGVRLVYASSAATYGDGSAGFDDDASLAALEQLRPLNLYGWTKHAFDLRVARAVADAPAASAAMGRAQVLQRLWAERVPQGPHDLGGQGQARRSGGRRGGAAVPLHRAGPGRWRAAARLHLGRRRGRCRCCGCSIRPRSAACSTSAPARRAATSIWRNAVCDAAGVPRKVEFIDMPEALRGQYQSFTEASMARLRAAGYARPVHAAGGRRAALRAGPSDAARPLRMIPVLLFPQFDPVIVHIGPFAIRWYALAYIAGLVLGWRLLRHLVQQSPAVATAVQADDFLTWATLGVVLGGRLGYVLFYQPSVYLAHPAHDLRRLGRRHELPRRRARRRSSRSSGSADATPSRCSASPIVSRCAAPIGLGFGRIANFINGELWGRPAPDWLPWAMIFPNGGPVPRASQPALRVAAGRRGAVSA